MSHATDQQAAAVAAGLQQGQAILAGHLGPNFEGQPGGQHHRALAAATARYLGVDTPALIEQVVACHRERIERAPDPQTYPEARDARDLLLARHRGLAQAGMDEALIALVETLGFWTKHVMVHRYGKPANPVAIKALRERCRVVYLPESDQGPLHYKNVDNPMSVWEPRPREPQGQRWPHSPLFFDGVGSGLHVDEEPREIFPLDVKSLCQRHCTTVSDAEQFMLRYQYFWEGGNLLIHDDHGQSVAIDGASCNRKAVRRPGPDGISYINGMSSFDDDYEAFIAQQRRRYLTLTQQDETGVEGCYFRFCTGVLRNMKKYMAELSAQPTLAKLHAVMGARDADGAMCKSGGKVHPDEVDPGYTLMQRLYFLSSRIMFVRQWRGHTPVWEDAWEMVQYG